MDIHAVLISFYSSGVASSPNRALAMMYQSQPTTDWHVSRAPSPKIVLAHLRLTYSLDCSDITDAFYTDWLTSIPLVRGQQTNAVDAVLIAYRVHDMTP